MLLALFLHITKKQTKKAEIKLKRSKFCDTLYSKEKEKRGQNLEELEGVLTEIRYQNEINSYTVGTFETEQYQITVVGYLPFISRGDTLKIIGKFVEHKDYGEQFKIETFEKLMPQTLGALENYLANGNVKGIGPITAKK